jgi:hypothetical protein
VLVVQGASLPVVVAVVVKVVLLEVLVVLAALVLLVLHLGEVTMRHAIVVGGTVINVVMADEVTGRANGWIPNEEAGPGWTYDGENFSSNDDPAARYAEHIRGERNELLRLTDLFVYPDKWAKMTVEQQNAWTNYRQALRDLPLQKGFPYQIVWPQKPE